MTSVKVEQLTSVGTGRAFMNVNSENGHIEVWGSCYNLITILCQTDSVEWHLLQFDSKEWYDEWLLENEKYYKLIVHILPQTKDSK